MQEIKRFLRSFPNIGISLLLLIAPVLFYAVFYLHKEAMTEIKAVKDTSDAIQSNITEIKYSIKDLRGHVERSNKNTQDSLAVIFYLNRQWLMGINRIPGKINPYTLNQTEELKTIIDDYFMVLQDQINELAKKPVDTIYKNRSDEKNDGGNFLDEYDKMKIEKGRRRIK